MLLIVDYFSGSPSADIAPYCDYIVQQAYSNQTGFERTIQSSFGENDLLRILWSFL